MTATGADIVNYGLKKSGILGVGMVASSEDFTDALADLNDMISQWSTKKYLTWGELDVSFVSNGTTTGYTVGPGGNFNVSPAPDHVEAAYVRQLQASPGLPVDTPLRVVQSREDYSRFSIKQNFISFPEYVFLDTSTFPTNTLFVYPWPNASIYEVHILLKNVMPILALNSILSNWPPVYMAALKFNLARRLRQAYGKGMNPDTELNKLAQDALETLRGSNMQVPQLQMPSQLVRQSSGYNILNDQF